MTQPHPTPIPPREPVVIARGVTYTSVTTEISDLVYRPITPLFFFTFSFLFLVVMMLVASIGYLFIHGVGIWAINIPVAWGFAIVNFVWWIGIGHAGTFISAMLLLMRQNWRTSINRFAEAMTLFAVACAGLFPLLHLGRPKFFYWLLPYPNTMALWPQFRSALVWDVFAVSTYFTVSLIFWYVGLIPDLATLRDRAKKKWQWTVFGVMAMGWRGASRHWTRYQTAYLLLAGLAAPLVVSVHSIVGMDFAESLVPGWHSTIFPPYFVAGAIFSGFAMVLNLAIPMRYLFGIKNLITIRHIDGCCKLMLVTGLIVAFGYGSEIFVGWYSGSAYESFMTLNRMTGPYAPCFWLIIFCNVCTPQILWFERVRQSPILVFFISLIIQTGMWMERFVIIIISLHRDFLPTSWGMYYPTFWDYSTFIGTLGFFTFMFLLFCRTLPVIAIAETRELVHETHGGTREPQHMEPAHAR